MKNNTVQKNIPSGWRKTSLGSLATRLKTGGTPTSTNKSFYGGEIPFVKIDDMTTSGKYLSSTVNFISDEGLKNSSAWLVPMDSILYSIYATVGEVSINKIDVATNQAIMGVVVDEKEADRDYLYQYLLFLKPSLKKFFKETTQKNLTSQIVKDLEIYIPNSKTEQQKIAEILGKVDENILKTQEVIEATEKLKRGLMQQLFTNGFENIKFDVVPLGTVAKVQGGYSFSSSDFSNSGTPVLRISNIKNGYIVLDDIKFYPKEITKRIATFLLNKNDVVVAMSGATTGKIGIVVETDLPLLINQRVGRFVPTEKIDEKYLYNIVISDFYQKRIWDYAIGGAQPNVSGPQLESIEIPLPNISIQKKIAEILSAVDEKILVNKKLKEKLTFLKKGLMQDLLSGTVRINI